MCDECCTATISVFNRNCSRVHCASLTPLQFLSNSCIVTDMANDLLMTSPLLNAMGVLTLTAGCMVDFIEQCCPYLKALMPVKFRFALARCGGASSGLVVLFTHRCVHR